MKRVTAGERTTAIQWHMSGTFDGAPFQGIKPTGRRIELTGCDCIEWEDGKLVKNTVYYDGLGFARGRGHAAAAGLRGRTRDVRRVQRADLGQAAPAPAAESLGLRLETGHVLDVWRDADADRRLARC